MKRLSQQDERETRLNDGPHQKNLKLIFEQEIGNL